VAAGLRCLWTKHGFDCLFFKQADLLQTELNKQVWREEDIGSGEIHSEGEEVETDGSSQAPSVCPGHSD
jgi:hypothetical protein